MRGNATLPKSYNAMEIKQKSPELTEKEKFKRRKDLLRLKSEAEVTETI
jgi:hypothetical protein